MTVDESERSPQGDLFQQKMFLKPAASYADLDTARVSIGNITIAYRATKARGTLTDGDVEYRYHSPPGQSVYTMDQVLQKRIVRTARIAINKARRAAGKIRKRKLR